MSSESSVEYDTHSTIKRHERMTTENEEDKYDTVEDAEEKLKRQKEVNAMKARERRKRQKTERCTEKEELDILRNENKELRHKIDDLNYKLTLSQAVVAKLSAVAEASAPPSTASMPNNSAALAALTSMGVPTQLNHNRNALTLLDSLMKQQQQTQQLSAFANAGLAALPQESPLAASSFGGGGAMSRLALLQALGLHPTSSGGNGGDCVTSFSTSAPSIKSLQNALGGGLL